MTVKPQAIITGTDEIMQLGGQQVQSSEAYRHYDLAGVTPLHSKHHYPMQQQHQGTGMSLNKSYSSEMQQASLVPSLLPTPQSESCFPCP